jgi:hypothetical protein
MTKNHFLNAKVAQIYLYQDPGNNLLVGVEFFDKAGISLIECGFTNGNPLIIPIEENERIIGVNAVGRISGRMYDVKFKIARVI